MKVFYGLWLVARTPKVFGCLLEWGEAAENPAQRVFELV